VMELVNIYHALSWSFVVIRPYAFVCCFRLY